MRQAKYTLGVQSDHQFLVGGDDPRRNRATRPTYLRAALRVGLFIQFQPEPGSVAADPGADGSSILPDPAGKHTGVQTAHSRGERWLLCERALDTDERKYYLLNLDATATLPDLVRVARSRWPLEQQYRELKDELGFDHFEGRTYRGWTHHVVLTAVAFAFLQTERLRADDDDRPTLPTVRFWVREIMAVLYVIGNRNLLKMLVSFQRNPPLRR